MKIRDMVVGRLAILAVAFFIGADFTLCAQPYRVVRPVPRIPFAEIQAFSNNPIALELVTNLMEEPQPELSVPEVSQTFSPPGTYWTVNGSAPLPFDPFPDLPVYAINTNGVYLIDNRSVDYEGLAVLQEIEDQLLGLTNSTLPRFTINTNGLWIETPPGSLATPGWFTVRNPQHDSGAEL